MNTRPCQLALPIGTILLALAPQSAARAQSLGTASGGYALQLEVVGRVTRVFTSDDKDDQTRLVALLLRGVSLDDKSAPSAGIHIPAPADILYVEVPTLKGSADKVPRVGDAIRAAVRDSGHGTWAAAGANGDWFQPTNTGPLPPSLPGGRPSDAPSDQPDATPAIEFRGMACEAKVIRGRIGLVVVDVKDKGPAHEAGFQRGDVLVAEHRKPFTSLADIRQLAQATRPLEITVVDVNSGKIAEVTLASLPVTQPAGDATPETPAQDPTAEAAQKIANSLGVTVEPTRVDARGAVKVDTVNPVKAGAEAGLEPGDVIVAVGQQRVADLNEFARLLPERGGKIILVVRDVRSGKDVPINVRAAATLAAAQAPQSEPEPPAASNPSEPKDNDSLGLATELTFFNQEAAVRIVAVQPGSPAARAGLRPGWIIIKAGDAPVMHPADLAKAEAGAAGSLKLLVADPDAGRQSTITITF